MRGFCFTCGKWFTSQAGSGWIAKKRKGEKHQSGVRLWLLEHLKGKSYRTIALDVDGARTWICRSVNQLLARFKSCVDVTEELKPTQYAGNFIADAKFIPVKEWMIEKPSFVPRSRKRRKIIRGLTHIAGCDYTTHDLPHAMLTRTEEQWAYELFFEKLKNLGYPLHSLTCDDKSSIRRACLKYFPDAKIQLCIRHYSEEIARKLKIRQAERVVQSFEKQIRKLKNDFLYQTHAEARLRAIQLTNRINDLEHRYGIIGTFSILLQSLIRVKTREQYTHFATELKTFFQRLYPLEHPVFQRRIVQIWKKFKHDKDLLFTSLRHPDLDIPRTTNLLEGYHSHWELRLSSIRGFESTETAKHYMNALVLKKRFSILTSCKGRFKPLNGKSPLEHSGGLQSALKDEDWVSFCISKEMKNAPV